MYQQQVESDIFSFEDLFSPLAVATENKKVVEAFKRLNAIGESARECLATQCFADYKKQLEQAKDAILDAMCAYTNRFIAGDSMGVDKYAVVMVRFITRVDSLRSLLNQVELDAKKGKPTMEIKDEK